MPESIDILQKVNRSEAPPFLYTRIEAEINEVQEMRLTPKFALAVCSIFLFMLCINFYVLSNSSAEKSTQSISYTETTLSPEYNSLY